MVNRETFYQGIEAKLFPAQIKLAQVDGIDAILDEWDRLGLTDKRWLAYMFATVYHETDKKMQPIEEYSRGKGKKYGVADETTGKIYFGRGLVQITWKDNYEKFAAILQLPLVEHPELALDPVVAVKILFKGMQQGIFTGKRLSNYFGSIVEDWIGARRIINGMDRAELIAGYATEFNNAIQLTT